jgi:hypothetical protein
MLEMQVAVRCDGGRAILGSLSTVDSHLGLTERMALSVKGPNPWSRWRSTTNTKLSDVCCRQTSLEWELVHFHPYHTPYPRIHHTLISATVNPQSLFRDFVFSLFPQSSYTPTKISSLFVQLHPHATLAHHSYFCPSSLINRQHQLQWRPSRCACPFFILKIQREPSF